MRKIALTLLLLFIVAMPARRHWAVPRRQITPSDAPPVYRELRRIQRSGVGLIINFSEQMAFSPDGTMIAAAGSGSTVNAWDIATGDVIHEFELETPQAVSWSPDGTMIAAGANNDYGFRVWDAATGEVVHDLDVMHGRHSSWSPDSRYLVTSVMVIFDAQTGKVVRPLGSNWYGIPYEAHWSPDGTMIATTTGWESAYMNIWSVEGERLDTYWGFSSASWSPDSTRIASATQVRDIATGLPVLVIPQMNNAIAWHPSGAWIASTGDAGEIYLWDAETGEQVALWQYEDCAVNGFDWSMNGNRFAINCGYGENWQRDLIIWERER